MVAANRDRQIERETQDRERWLQVILKGFFGFALTIITYLILFFESPLVGRSFTFSSFSLSPWVPFFALLAIALVLFRVFSNRWTKRPSTHLIEAIAFIGMVIAPLGFFDEYLWPYALVVSAVGTACLCFLWCLYLCDFSHGMLLSFVSASFAVSAGVVGVLYALNLDQIEFLVCECLTATGSLVLLMLSDVQAGAKLLITTNIESRDRAITTRYDRWTYSAIGLNLGFSLGLVTFLSRSEGFASGARPFTCFVVIFLAAVILLILRPRFDYAFLNYSKNFLVAFVAVFVVIGTLVSLDG